MANNDNNSSSLIDPSNSIQTGNKANAYKTNRPQQCISLTLEANYNIKITMSSDTKTPRDEDQEGPVKKKAKPTSPAKQSSLLQFFGKPKDKDSAAKAKVAEEKLDEIETKKSTPQTKEKSAEKSKTNDNDKNEVPGPIIPHQVSPDFDARWKVVENCMLVRCIKEDPRTKVAAFDVDGTLLVWRIAGWPSRFDHYELWSSTVFEKLRQLHDDGHKLVLFSNQGAIRGAFTGKKATFVKGLLEWVASKIDRPVSMVLSTNKKLGYHKPNPGMWEICEQHCNEGIAFDISSSFFVGDSVGDDDPQGGVDEKFAQNIGKLKGNATLKFYTPEAYFGPSDSDKRKIQGQLSEYDAPPGPALEARKGLLGGYFTGPVVLLLCGVQGSGKSTFCQQLFVKQDQYGDLSDSDSENDNTSRHPWVHVSQDTINKGKPGKREAVEEATRQALKNGQSVVVDRTHLDADQRKYFVDIAQELQVPVHILVFSPPKEVISKRVRERTNHPGGVEGEKGVRVAMMHLEKLVLPNYKDEGFDLISRATTENDVKKLSCLYRQVVHKRFSCPSTTTVLPRTVKLPCGTSMPSVALGTMNIGKRIAEQVVKTALELGFKAVDTAPTYNNEDVVGKGLAGAAVKDVFVIGKVPKRVTQPEQVVDELTDTLTKLGIPKVDLLLLHWPCDLIEAGTLKAVWEAMEKCVADGKCRALGVCNFSVDALRALLPHCTIPPAVNQVERHPLLPQMELLDFCSNQGIVLQAHTPLGQGKLLENNDVITEVAQKAKMTPAEAVLMWNLQHGVAVVPKSASKDHQQEIMSRFGDKKARLLSSEQMKALDSIKEKQRFVDPPFMKTPGKIYTWKS